MRVWPVGAPGMATGLHPVRALVTIAPVMGQRTFVGFGFGAIQGGLFLFEAHRTGRFDRLVVAEVIAEVVDSVRRAGGVYAVNVATRTGLKKHRIRGVEIYNPNIPADRVRLVEAIIEAREMATALPSVDYYDHGAASVAAMLAEAMPRKSQPAILYAGENHIRAAEILEDCVRARLGIEDVARLPEQCCFVNTVIGKMSKVVTDPDEIREGDLAPLTPDLPRALLVEEFNRILISRIPAAPFDRAIDVFEEKPDLKPFEEAKLYGHNATHALVGYLAQRRGYQYMSEVAADVPLMQFARAAFMEESGRALIHRWRGVDPLFTPAGFAAHVEELLQRMVNPWLRDAVARVTRDPRRKLAWDDRLIGVMRLALEAGITPHRYARGAAAALAVIAREESHKSPARLWDEIVVPDSGAKDAHRLPVLKRLVLDSMRVLDEPLAGTAAGLAT